MNPLARQPNPTAREASPVALVAPPEEQEYQQAREAFLAPERSGNKGLLLLGTLVLFALSMSRGNSVQHLAVLIPVLFFHELGHWSGMQLFGFKNVKMFFIPFFGAAVSGRNQEAKGWMEALVLLLGPLPGLLVGLSVAVGAAAVKSPVLVNVATMLLLINGFNLLPLVPLDGGRLFQLLIFSRHRYLENAFTLITSLLLMGVALALTTPILGVVAFFNVVGLMRQVRLLRQVRDLRVNHPSLDPTPEQLDDDTLRALHQSACLVTRLQKGASTADAAKLRAQAMKDLHQRVCQRPPSLLSSLGLFGLWFGGMVALLLGCVLVAGGMAPQRQGGGTASPPPSTSASATP